MVKKIDHIAIAVNDINEVARFYTDILKLDLSGVEIVTEQKTKVGFLKIGESTIELVQPASEDSPLVKFLETKGPGIHHICFEVDDIQATLDSLKQSGVRLIDEEAVTGSGGKKIAFIHPESTHGVLVELYEINTVEQGGER